MLGSARQKPIESRPEAQPRTAVGAGPARARAPSQRPAGASHMRRWTFRPSAVRLALVVVVGGLEGCGAGLRSISQRLFPEDDGSRPSSDCGKARGSPGGSCRRRWRAGRGSDLGCRAGTNSERSLGRRWRSAATGNGRPYRSGVQTSLQEASPAEAANYRLAKGWAHKRTVLRA